MSGLTVAHKGFGKYFVMDGETEVSGPHPKAEAEAFLGDPEKRRKAWERKLDQHHTGQREAIAAKLRKVLLEDHDPDTVELMLQRIVPIVAAGRDGLRRESRGNMRSRHD